MSRKSRAGSVCAVVATVLVAAFTVFGGASWAAGGKQLFVADELLVQVKAGSPKSEVDDMFRGQGAQDEQELAPIRVKRLKVPPQLLEKVKAALSRNPHVKFVENNHLAEGSLIPNDASYPSQWHLPIISAPQGWELNTGSSVVDIAVIDSGVDPAHPDLAAKLIPGFNFLLANSDTHDVYGHGTKVAGSAAALANNAIGVAGVAWNNPVMPLVVLDSTNYASYYNMAQAIIYAVDHGVRVINISLGGTSSSTTLDSAVNYAWSKGAIVIAAAGNNGSSAPLYPAGCSNVLAVGATDSNDNLASFSNYGNWVGVTAPGASILTTVNGGGYGAVSGTSFASPITAGLAALVLSVNPALTNQQVVDIIKNNCDDLGAPGFDPTFANGRINVYKSLLAAQQTIPQADTVPPTVSILSPGRSSVVSGVVTVAADAADNVGVSKVELYIDGALFAADAVAPYEFYWDTDRATEGSHSLEARAYDGAGNVSSSQVTIMVSRPVDRSAPVVTIANPLNGASVARLRKVLISAAAVDDTAVTKTELYIDGSLVRTVASAALSWSWNLRNVAGGQHTVLIRSSDAAGNVGEGVVTVYK